MGTDVKLHQGNSMSNPEEELKICSLDHCSGGMEGWGMIGFAENAFLLSFFFVLVLSYKGWLAEHRRGKEIIRNQHDIKTKDSYIFKNRIFEL